MPQQATVLTTQIEKNRFYLIDQLMDRLPLSKTDVMFLQSIIKRIIF